MTTTTYVFLDDRTRATGIGLVEVCTEDADVAAADCVDVGGLSATTIGRGARGGVSYTGSRSSPPTVDVCVSLLGKKPNIF